MVEGPVPKRLEDSSSSEQIRLTPLLEIPAAPPSACTRSSTLRVETPWT